MFVSGCLGTRLKKQPVCGLVRFGCFGLRLRTANGKIGIVRLWLFPSDTMHNMITLIPERSSLNQAFLHCWQAARSVQDGFPSLHACGTLAQEQTCVHVSVETSFVGIQSGPTSSLIMGPRKIWVPILRRCNHSVLHVGGSCNEDFLTGFRSGRFPDAFLSRCWGIGHRLTC